MGIYINKGKEGKKYTCIIETWRYVSEDTIRIVLDVTKK